MRLVLCAVLAAVAAGHARAGDDGDNRWDARLTAFSGEVAVHPADGSDPVEAQQGMPLDEGDRVTTGSGASAEVSLDGESLISLDENSDFKIEKAEREDSSFSLSLGSLLAKIQSLGSRRLSVRSPSAVAAVRGTEFGVEVEGEQSHVGVFDEGRVEVRGAAGEPRVLAANQETSVKHGMAPQAARALARFAVRRQAMKARIARLQAVRRAWRQFPPGARKRRRLAALKRRVKAIKRRQRAAARQQRRLRDRKQDAPERKP